MNAEKVLICTVGGTPAPLVKSALSYVPGKVFLIASQETVEAAAEVKREIRRNIPDCEVMIETVEEAESLEGCLRAAWCLMSGIVGSGAEIRVDYTGGTKSMSAALVLATAGFDVKYSYVSGERRDGDGVGRVVDGYEKLVEMNVPLTYLYGTGVRQVRMLYNGWNLSAAAATCNELARFFEGRHEARFFSDMELVMEAYHLWDVFEHRKAKARFEKVDFTHLKTYDLAKKDTGLVRFLDDTEKLAGDMDRLISDKTGGVVSPTMELARDLYANALRRADEERYDDANLRLYRVVEMAVQVSLREDCGIEHTSKVLLDELPEEVHSILIPNDKNRVNIGQESGVSIIREYDTPLWRRMEPHERVRKGLCNSRNYCYLEHQLREKKSKEKTRRTFEKYADYVLTVILDNAEIVRFPAWESAA